MDNTLTIQLWFLTVGIPAAVEAYKARDRERYVLSALAAPLVVMGFAWPWVSNELPNIQKMGADLVSDPGSWFTMLVVIFLVSKSYWTKPVSSTGNNIVSVADLHEVNKLRSDFESLKKQWAETNSALVSKIDSRLEKYDKTNESLSIKIQVLECSARADLFRIVNENARMMLQKEEQNIKDYYIKQGK